MSFASTLVELSLPLLSFGEFVRAFCLLFLVASLLMFFRPLLNGLRRALVLAVRARLSRKLPGTRVGVVPGQRA